jgi:acetyl-CoA acetyltransferase
MNDVVIVSAVRTAIGKFGGSLKDFSPGQLGSIVLKDALRRADIQPDEVDEVIMGNVLSGGQGMNIARQSSIWAGIPTKVPACCINKVCGSGLKPLATVVSYGFCAIPLEIMGMGPVCATRKALERADLSLDDIDLIEVNEAFASQSVAVGKELGWDNEKVNVNGGAIALGHPIGASGTRILVTLIHELTKRKGTYGLAALCIGGGQGIAMIVRR